MPRTQRKETRRLRRLTNRYGKRRARFIESAPSVMLAVNLEGLPRLIAWLSRRVVLRQLRGSQPKLCENRLMLPVYHQANRGARVFAVASEVILTQIHASFHTWRTLLEDLPGKRPRTRRLRRLTNCCLKRRAPSIWEDLFQVHKKHRFNRRPYR